jgi:hypothetical protein
VASACRIKGFRLLDASGLLEQMPQAGEAVGDRRVVGARQRLRDSQGPAHHRFGFPEVPQGHQQVPQVREAPDEIRMVRTIPLFGKRQGAAEQGFPLLDQEAQTGKVLGDQGVIRAVALFLDGQALAHERLRLPRPAGGPQQVDQGVQAGGEVHRASPRRRLGQGQGSPDERFHLFQAAPLEGNDRQWPFAFAGVAAWPCSGSRR